MSEGGHLRSSFGRQARITIAPSIRRREAISFEKVGRAATKMVMIHSARDLLAAAGEKLYTPILPTRVHISARVTVFFAAANLARPMRWLTLVSAFGGRGLPPSGSHARLWR